MSIVKIRSEKHRGGWWWTARCNVCPSPGSSYRLALPHPDRGFVRHLNQPDALATALRHIDRQHRAR